MTKLSGQTTFIKQTFPRICFSFLGVIALLGLVSGQYLAIMAPMALGTAIYWLFRYTIWDMVDELYDCRDYLLVRNNGLETTIPFSEIVRVSQNAYLRFRITIHFRHLIGGFGRAIFFIAPASIDPFAGSILVQQLSARVLESKQ